MVARHGDVESHICSSDHEVGRQWTMRTNLRQQRAAVPQHVKAVLHRLESGAVFSAMLEDGVEGGLVVALEAITLTDRTRLVKNGAVKNPVCKTPKESSVNAGGIEQARYAVEKRT